MAKNAIFDFLPVKEITKNARGRSQYFPDELDAKIFL